MKIRDKAILIFLFIASFIFIFHKLSFILTPLIISFVIAYFLRPLVNYFADKKIADSLAILIIMAVFFLVIGLIFYFILPIIYQQSSAMLLEIPSYFDFLRREIYPQYIKFLADNNIYFNGGFEELLNSYNSEILKFAKNFTFKVFSSTAALINIFSIIFLMPILIFYLLKDWNKINSVFNNYLPKDSAQNIKSNLSDIDSALSGYIRGQMLVCLIMAMIYAILLSLTGLKFGFLIGFFTGIFSFIPYVGALVGFFIAMIVAILQWGFSLFDISYVILAIIIGQIIESNFLTPKLIGDKIGLHPVWVILGIFIFGAIFGFIGVIFATPLTAIGGVLIKNIAREYKKRFV